MIISNLFKLKKRREGYTPKCTQSTCSREERGNEISLISRRDAHVAPNGETFLMVEVKRTSFQSLPLVDVTRRKIEMRARRENSIEKEYDKDKVDEEENVRAQGENKIHRRTPRVLVTPREFRREETSSRSIPRPRRNLYSDTSFPIVFGLHTVTERENKIGDEKELKGSSLFSYLSSYTLHAFLSRMTMNVGSSLFFSLSFSLRPSFFSQHTRFILLSVPLSLSLSPRKAEEEKREKER